MQAGGYPVQKIPGRSEIARLINSGSGKFCYGEDVVGIHFQYALITGDSPRPVANHCARTRTPKMRLYGIEFLRAVVAREAFAPAALPAINQSYEFDNIGLQSRRRCRDRKLP